MLANIISVALASATPAASSEIPAQPILGHRSVVILRKDTLRFKDLNRNGRLDPYEDWRLPASVRADDLLQRMTAAQKAGLMVHPIAPSVGDLFAPTALDLPPLIEMVQKQHIRYFLNSVSAAPSAMAAMANAAQEAAERAPLGIPITFSSDPRNQFSATGGQSVAAGRFSLWPDAPGLAATGDVELVRHYGQIIAAEHRAVGIDMTLSPMADLATEPRWGRISGTFGSNPDLVGRFVAAYVEGAQGSTEGVTPGGLATVVKHWVGYGALPDGYDAHLYYGRKLAFPGGRFMDHVKPFEAAFAVKPASVMPTYGIAPPSIQIAGKPAEQVGASFSHQMISELLRKQYGFNGIVITDFLITHDCAVECQEGTRDFDKIGMPWGVETLSEDDRILKAIDAGIDQLGGSTNSEAVLKLALTGRLSQARLDASVHRLLEIKFKLGEFENPYADPATAEKVVGSNAFVVAGLDAQRRSLVMLKNDSTKAPLSGTLHKLWLWNVDPAVARAHGFEVVATPQEADAALLRVTTPSHNRPNSVFGDLMKEGSLSFAPDNPERIAAEKARAAHIPVVAIVHLDRAAVLSGIVDNVDAMFAEFGASDGAIFDVLTGAYPVVGTLPFELPSSDKAVDAQLPDVPDDSIAPLYPSGFGLRYK